MADNAMSSYQTMPRNSAKVMHPRLMCTLTTSLLNYIKNNARRPSKSTVVSKTSILFVCVLIFIYVFHLHSNVHQLSYKLNADMVAAIANAQNYRACASLDQYLASQSSDYIKWYMSTDEVSRKVDLKRLLYTAFNCSSNRRQSGILVYACTRPCGGWGDRLRKISAVIMLALSSNRRFCIVSRHPCKLDNFLSVSMIDWQCGEDFVNQAAVELNENVQMDQVVDMLSSKQYAIVLSVKSVAFYKYVFARSDDHGVLMEARRRLGEYGFGDTNHGVEHLAPLFTDMLFKPSDILAAKLKKHTGQVRSHNRDQDLVCVQIRQGRNPSIPNDHHYPSRVNISIEMVEELQKLFRFRGNRSTAMYLTSDSIDSQRDFITHQARYRTAPMDTSIYASWFGIGHMDKADGSVACQILERTLLDFYMMQMCDFSLISRSFFGIWASLRRVTPFQNLYLHCMNQVYHVRNNKDLLAALALPDC